MLTLTQKSGWDTREGPSVHPGGCRPMLKLCLHHELAMGVGFSPENVLTLLDQVHFPCQLKN